MLNAFLPPVFVLIVLILARNTAIAKLPHDPHPNNFQKSVQSECFESEASELRVPDGSDDTCAGISTCTACNSSVCGWCPDRGCVQGTREGPSSGACANWVYFANWNSNVCSCVASSIDNAYSCLNVISANCGWCGTSPMAGLCMAGNSTGEGPYSGTCVAPDIYDSRCSKMSGSSCSACAKIASCGWCLSTSTCSPATASGSRWNASTSQCLRSQWVPYTEDCPLPGAALGMDQKVGVVIAFAMLAALALVTVAMLVHFRNALHTPRWMPEIEMQASPQPSAMLGNHDLVCYFSVCVLHNN